MNDLAITLRHAQLHNQNLHHLASGPTSQQDHQLAGGFYEEIAGQYDSLVELIIGLGMPINLPQVAEIASKALPAIRNNAEGFAYSLEVENEICEHVARLVPDVVDGAQNFLQGLAESSLARQYKIKQRLA